VGPGSKFAILLPIKAGTTVTGTPGSEMFLPIQSLTDQFTGVELFGVQTFRYQQDEEMKRSIMPKILPQLLASGVIQPNRVRLMNQGSFKERVEQGLELLRNNKVSGEKVVVEVKP